MPTVRAVALLISLTFIGCAQFGPVVASPTVVPGQALAIDNARGPVSAARSKQIVENQKSEPGADNILDHHLAIESALTGSPLVTDNHARLLQDGEQTYGSMFEAIAGAKHHINLETYILTDDEIGQRFADALIAKRGEGLQVNLLYDSVGTLGVSDAFFQRLKDAGVKIVEYNPVNPLEAKTGWDPNQRNHRKLLVVDGETAFLGGLNISGVYAGRSSLGKSKPVTKPGEPVRRWRDTHVRIDGPVAAEFQKVFLSTWAQQKGPELNYDDYFRPKPRARGKHVVRAIASSPDDPYSTIYSTLLSSINHAEKSISVTMAYFVPDPLLIETLQRAAQRGVQVRLILPRHSDAKLVQSAGRAQYGELLSHGVQVYERREVLLHAKTAVVDGVWSTVGSANLDWRSFLHNQELNAVVLGPEFAAQMEEVFERDLAASERITLDAWNQRPLRERVNEVLGQLIQYWL